MPRKVQGGMPIVISGVLYTDDPETTGVRLSETAWLTWLENATAFYYDHALGGFSVRKYAHRRGHFWYAFKRLNGRLRKLYLGDGKKITRVALDGIAQRFAVLREDKAQV